jgi:hypothetical protein
MHKEILSIRGEEDGVSEASGGFDFPSLDFIISFIKVGVIDRVGDKGVNRCSPFRGA